MATDNTPHSKHKDVDALISSAQELYVGIEEQYQASLNRQTIPDKLLVDIKSFMGDLRSALDYLNSKIPNSGSYFPICNSQKDFNGKTKKIDPAVKNLLSKYQPYNDNDWLKYFNILNNKNKHVTLVPQKRTETRQTRVTANDGSSVSWGAGATFGAGVSIGGVPIDPTTQLPVPNDVVKTEKIVWVAFVFDNSVSPELPGDINALALLKESIEKVKKMISNIEAVV